MASVTKDMLIGDVVRMAPQAAGLFQEIGMHCLGCALASGETVAQACTVHGVDADAFVAKINELMGE